MTAVLEIELPCEWPRDIQTFALPIAAGQLTINEYNTPCVLAAECLGVRWNQAICDRAHHRGFGVGKELPRTRFHRVGC